METASENSIVMHKPRTTSSLLAIAIIFLASCKRTPPTETPTASPIPSVKEVPIKTMPEPGSVSSPSLVSVRPSGPIQYTDVTTQAGIHFKYNNGAFGKKYLPETMGPGACFLDYDNDGWQDILLVN